MTPYPLGDDAMIAQTAKEATPQQLLNAAGAALVKGDAEASAGSLWQAVVAATAAAARKRGWRYDGEGSIRGVILRLDGECADRRPLLPMLLTAEALRPPKGSLCYLAQDGLLAYAPEVTRLVIRLLETAGIDYRSEVADRMADAGKTPRSAQEYLAASEQAFAIGDRLEGASNLWQAVQAAASAAPKRAWSHDADGQIREVILDLETDKGHQERMLQFSVAETFKYYVEGFVPLKRYQIARPRRSAVELTHYLLKQAEQETAQ